MNREKQEEQGNFKRVARELDQVEDDLERYKDDEQQHKANVQRLQVIPDGPFLVHTS